jgi:hypothetical protein
MTRLSKVNTLKTELITLIGSLKINNNIKKILEKYGHMYRISDIENQLKELNNSDKEDFLISKIKALKSFKNENRYPNINRFLDTRGTRIHDRNGIKPTKNNILKSSKVKKQKQYNKILKKTKKKRSHGRSKRLLKSTRNTLKRKTGIGMKKIKVSNTYKTKQELKQNMIFIDYDEFNNEFKSNLDFFRHFNLINKELSGKGYNVAMITSKDTLSVPKGTEKSFFMSNSTSPNNNKKEFVNAENIILVSTSDNIKKFKARLLHRNLLSISNPSMIVVNNHNGIKILKNLINDAKSSYPPFTLDSKNNRMSMSRLQTINNNNIAQFNNNIEGANFSENLKRKISGSKRTIIHSSLVKKGMSTNIRNTNDIVVMEVNDRVGITQDMFHKVHEGVNNRDYSVCIFLDLTQYEKILGLDLEANRPVRPSRPTTRPVPEETESESEPDNRTVYSYNTSKNRKPPFTPNPAFNPTL